MKNNAVPIYIRVSSEDQVKGTSLETQLHDCRNIATKEGYEIGEIFADEGESAKTVQGRPAFLRLLEYVKRHKPKAVIVWKIDRLARNNLDAQIVRSKLSALECRLISATEPISDDPSGKFMFDVLSAVAEYDNRLRAERSRLGMMARAKDGYWVNPPPFGYSISRKEGNKPILIPDNEKAALVKKAFQMAANGCPQTEIITTLAPEGLTAASGKPMAKQTLSKILANPVYTGAIRSRLAGGGGISQKGRWEPIVSDKLWLEVQGKLRKGKMPRLAQGEFPLKAVLLCGLCGKKITGSYSKGRSERYPYYHCPKCSTRARVEDVEAALQDKIGSLAMTPESLEHLEHHIKNLMISEFGPKKKAKDQAQKKLMALEAQLDRLIQLHLSDGIDRKRYDAKRTEIEWQIIASRQILNDTSTDKINLVDEFHRARQLLLQPGLFWRSAGTHERRDIFALFFPAPLQISVNKKVGTITLDGSNCQIWHA